ncbi:MAG: IS4 family transposase [Lentisphaerae bacterium]|jgi:IS4 transposase|nr:IS4 family transposase [Lentisphaerota bacterium]
MNLRGNILEFIHISDGRMHDVNILDNLIPMPGAYYLMDRAYLDFTRRFEINTCRAFFVTRAKTNFKFQRRYSHSADRSTGLICEQTVLLTNFYPARAYPEPLRRIKFRNPDDPSSLLVFLTNDFTLPAMTIAKLYKARWMVELFFKWSKHHLRIKTFLGTTPNAVKTQIWIAISTLVSQ